MHPCTGRRKTSNYSRPAALARVSPPPEWVPPLRKKAVPALASLAAAVGSVTQARIMRRRQLTANLAGTSATDIVNLILSEI
jgi:hypothetical protein